jgi:hypothetical protein
MSTKVAEVWTGVSSALEKDRCDEETGGFEAKSGRNYFICARSGFKYCSRRTRRSSFVFLARF